MLQRCTLDHVIDTDGQKQRHIQRQRQRQAQQQRSVVPFVFDLNLETTHYLFSLAVFQTEDKVPIRFADRLHTQPGLVQEV